MTFDSENRETGEGEKRKLQEKGRSREENRMGLLRFSLSPVLCLLPFSC
jgi:hypothetical protein